MSDDATADEVERKAERIRRDRHRPATWHHLAHVGVLGWVFILPVVTCAWLGHWAASWSHHLWPAVVGVVAGIALGSYLVFRNLSESLAELDEDPADPGDEEPPPRVGADGGGADRA